MRATRVGADTHLAQLARMVEQAQSGKADVQRLADRVSGIFVPVVLVLAVLYRPLGDWMARVFTSTHDTRLERGVYRAIGVDPRAELFAKAAS